MKKLYLLAGLAALAPAAEAGSFDYSGNGRAAAAIFRPATGLWAIRDATRLYYGALGDTAAPGDYRGNGTAAIGVFRPESGLWAIRGVSRVYFGRTGDSAVSGDYTGDGRYDVAVFRPRSGLWAVRKHTRVYFGGLDDTPVPADYNGDGRCDIGIFRRESGLWAIRGVTRAYFGAAGHRPVPTDYDGDGRADIAVFDGSRSLWAVRGLTRIYFGRTGDLPIPGNFDGASGADIGVFRPAIGLWAVKGITRAYFGGEADIPVSSRICWQPPDLPRPGVEVSGRNFDEKHLSRLTEAKASLTRLNYLSWKTVEPTAADPSNYNWEVADRRLELGADRVQEMIVVVADVPSWAGRFPSAPVYRERLPDFAEFLHAAVSRYKNPPYNVKFWELFNEPDGTKNVYGSTINCWGYHGDRYAEMLKLAYPAIKAADPDAVVLLGGLAHDNFVDEGGEGKTFYRWFLHDVLAHGGGDFFDYMNFHYYYFHRDVWGSIKGKAEHFRNILAGYGFSKPMLCSEVGIWGDEDHYEIQARYVPAVYARGLAAGLKAVIWYPLATLPGWNFEGGLMLEDPSSGGLTAKPAFQAYRTMSEQLAGRRYAGEVSGDGVEGYSFRPAGGGRTRQVLWTDIAEQSDYRERSFTAGSLRVVDKLGGVTEITDGSAQDRDGRQNGRVVILIGPSPVYVEIFP